LIPALTGSPNASFIHTFGTWVNSMCTASPCSDATISSVVKNITAGCASDGGISSALLENLQSGQFIYPTARKILCLQDSGKSCVTETLFNLQGYFANTTWSANVSDSSIGSLIADVGTFVQTLGTLNDQIHGQIGNDSTLTRRRRFGARSINEAQLEDPAGFNPNSPRTTVNALTMPANLTCTTCISSAATLLNTDYPGSMDALFPGVSSVCGVSLKTNDTSKIGPAKAAAAHSSAMSAFRGAHPATILSVLVATMSIFILL